MNKPFWDLEEIRNYKAVNSLLYKSKYNIVSHYKNKGKAIVIFTMIDNFIRRCVSSIRKHFNSIPSNLKDGFKVFLDIHPNKHRLFELPVNSQFIGLNKPKNIAINNRLPSVGKDGLLKANSRNIFIKIRNNNGTFMPIDNIFETVIHELVHTAANHVKWRNNDHGYDFYLYYSFLKNAK